MSEKCDHKGKGIAVMPWGACCACCGEPYPYVAPDALTDAQELAAWLPIATAPKDGSDVLLSSPHWNGDVVVGSWSFEGWRDRDDSDKLEPTHWMPLPLPPPALSTPHTPTGE
ncbi:DUF551 domain-containing protein [Agrobacterium tumefaciens]|nr:DUF551 domain-containing protein [Agrobacterium tumefaciens]